MATPVLDLRDMLEREINIPGFGQLPGLMSRLATVEEALQEKMYAEPLLVVTSSSYLAPTIIVSPLTDTENPNSSL